MINIKKIILLSTLSATAISSAQAWNNSVIDSIDYSQQSMFEAPHDKDSHFALDMLNADVVPVSEVKLVGGEIPPDEFERLLNSPKRGKISQPQNMNASFVAPPAQLDEADKPQKMAASICTTPKELVRFHENLDNNFLGGSTVRLADVKIAQTMIAHAYDRFDAESATGSDAESEKIRKTYINKREALKNDGWIIKDFSAQSGFWMSTFGFVAIRGDLIVIATRGTRTFSGDWATNLDGATYINLEDINAGIGHAHYGFASTHQSMQDQIKQIILDHCKVTGKPAPKHKYVTCGHSLGGALALLNAIFLTYDADLGILADDPENTNGRIIHISNAAPRALFRDTVEGRYEKILGRSTLRFVNKGGNATDAGDLVPAVAPGFLGYKHLGAQIRFQADLHKDPLSRHTNRVYFENAENAFVEHLFDKRIYEGLVSGSTTRAINYVTDPLTWAATKTRNTVNAVTSSISNAGSAVANAVKSGVSAFTGWWK